ncbi:MAG: RimK/LysX family protein [Bacteroidota bacterium]
MLTKKNNLKLIGRREFVDFPLLGVFNIEAKIDTGAYTSSIHCKNISVIKENNKQILTFILALDDNEVQKTQRFEEFSKKKIKNSFGEKEERYIIKTLIKIGSKKIKTTVSLSDRANMRYPVLIGRKLVKGKFLIDVYKIHTGGIPVTDELTKLINLK